MYLLIGLEGKQLYWMLIESLTVQVSLEDFPDAEQVHLDGGSIEQGDSDGAVPGIRS